MNAINRFHFTPSSFTNQLLSFPRLLTQRVVLAALAALALVAVSLLIVFKIKARLTNCTNIRDERIRNAKKLYDEACEKLNQTEKPLKTQKEELARDGKEIEALRKTLENEKRLFKQTQEALEPIETAVNSSRFVSNKSGAEKRLNLTREQFETMKPISDQQKERAKKRYDERIVPAERSCADAREQYQKAQENLNRSQDSYEKWVKNPSNDMESLLKMPNVSQDEKIVERAKELLDYLEKHLEREKFEAQKEYDERCSNVEKSIRSFSDDLKKAEEGFQSFVKDEQFYQEKKASLEEGKRKLDKQRERFELKQNEYASKQEQLNRLTNDLRDELNEKEGKVREAKEALLKAQKPLAFIDFFKL